MKIDLQANYNLYQKKLSESSYVKSSPISATDSLKEDVNAISKGVTTVSDKCMVHLKASVQSHVSAPADPERLQQLRECIKNGQYYIPTDAIVNSILTDE